MSAAVRGLKLHSIIEKLSVQFGHEGESESASPQQTGEDVSINRRKQRKSQDVKKTRKDSHEQSDADNSLINDDSGRHAPETPTQPLRTASKGQDSVQRESHNKDLPWYGGLCFRQADETRGYLRDHILKKGVMKQVFVQNRPHIKLPRWQKKKSQSRQAKILNRSTNQDLCVNMDGIINLVPQLDGSGVLFPVGKRTREPRPPPPKLLECHICIAKFEDQKELDSHLEQDHQDDESESAEEVSEDDSYPAHEDKEDGGDDESESAEEVSEDDSYPTHEDIGGGEQVDETEQDTAKTRRLTRNLRKSLLEKYSNDQSPDNDLCIDLKSVINMATGLEDIECVKASPRERPCGNCNKVFESLASLKLHREENPECASHHAAALARRHSKPKEDLVCRCCGKRFQWKKDREIHFAISTACQESLKCPKCGRQSKRFSSFQDHMLTHYEERLHKCDQCEASFTHKSYLTRHHHIHDDVKRYPCKHCNKQFTYRAGLRAHQWTHTGQKPFKCEYCEMRFTSSSSMRMHAKKHTGDLPYKCDVCGRGFAKNHGLKMHLTSHSDQKPFVCEICGKGFKRKDHLRLHEVIHSERKPYQCDTCQKTFNQHVCLKRHLPCRELERRQKRSKSRSEPGKGEEKNSINKTAVERPSRRKKEVKSKTALAPVKKLHAEKRKKESRNAKKLPKQGDILSTDSAETHSQNEASDILKRKPRSLKQAPATSQVKLSAGNPRTAGTDAGITSSSLVPSDTQHPRTGNLNAAGLATAAENAQSDALDSSGVQLFYPLNTTPNNVAPTLLFPTADAFSANALTKDVYSDGFSTRVPDVTDDLGSVLSSMDQDHLTALIDQTASFFAPIQS